jgi:glutathione S-transferase
MNASLKIWGRMSSINVKKVVWAAQELGLAFERADTGGTFGLTKTPEALQRNPNALVPVMDDAGFVLWESNVMVRYLCKKHSLGKLYPRELHAQFEAERWMDWQQTTFNPAGRNAFWQLVRVSPELRDLNLVAQSVAHTEPLLDMLEHQLTNSPYVAGGRFTMADIPLACEIHRWWGLPRHRPAYPHIEQWYAQIHARPAAQGVLDLTLS